MGVREGVEDLQHQLHPVVGGEVAPVRELVDGVAIDVFKDQVGLAGGRDAGVEQPGDPGVRQPGERAPLTPEALGAHRVEGGQVQQLHGDLTLEAPVDPPAEPD